MTVRVVRRTRLGIGVAVAVAVATPLGWLLWPRPPGASVLYAGTTRYAATIAVGSPRVGRTTVTVTLATHTGAPVGNARVFLQASMPLMGLATPAIPAASWGTGRYDVSGVPLMTTGPWRLRLSIIDAGDVTDTLDVPVTVAG
ncbi:FixH family protein [Micromonospora sp. NPDC049559]|uniref:FixH family protein n=1 Tax=Micromonospora sp. NPDC049559 TaxID=3155923 RepID=UPI00343ABD7F